MMSSMPSSKKSMTARTSIKRFFTLKRNLNPGPGRGFFYLQDERNTAGAGMRTSNASFTALWVTNFFRRLFMHSNSTIVRTYEFFRPTKKREESYDDETA
jgi:hypothetical protein